SLNSASPYTSPPRPLAAGGPPPAGGGVGLLRQARGGGRLLEQRLHGGGNVAVGGDREIKPGRRAALQVDGDLRLPRRDPGVVPVVGRQRQVLGVQHRNADAAGLHRGAPRGVERLLATVAAER